MKDSEQGGHDVRPLLMLVIRVYLGLLSEPNLLMREKGVNSTQCVRSALTCQVPCWALRIQMGEKQSLPVRGSWILPEVEEHNRVSTEGNDREKPFNRGVLELGLDR